LSNWTDCETGLSVLARICSAILNVYARDPGPKQQKAENDGDLWQNMLDNDQNFSFLNPPRRTYPALSTKIPAQSRSHRVLNLNGGFKALSAYLDPKEANGPPTAEPVKK
jgi:hypothetical protein